MMRPVNDIHGFHWVLEFRQCSDWAGCLTERTYGPQITRATYHKGSFLEQLEAEN